MKQDLTEPEPLQLMLNKLAFRGLDVTRAPGYSVSVGDASLYKQELDLLRNGQVDVLGITSELA